MKKYIVGSFILSLACFSHATGTVTCEYTWNLSGKKFYQHFDVGQLKEKLIINRFTKEIYIFAYTEPSFFAKAVGFNRVKKEVWLEYSNSTIRFIKRKDFDFNKNIEIEYIQKNNVIEKYQNNKIVYEGDFAPNNKINSLPYIDPSILIHLPFINIITNVDISHDINIMGNNKIYPLTYFPMNGRVVLKSNNSEGEILFGLDRQTYKYNYNTERANISGVLTQHSCT